MRLLPLLAAAATLAAVPPARAAPRGGASSGPALALGIGSEYGAAGGELRYYFGLPGIAVQLAPHAGLSPASLATGVTRFFGGVAVVAGRAHRMVLDGGAGVLRAETLSLHGTRIAARPSYGFQLGVGYEYLSDAGLLFRILPLGASWLLDERASPSERGPALAASAAVGMKLW